MILLIIGIVFLLVALVAYIYALHKSNDIKIDVAIIAIYAFLGCGFVLILIYFKNNPYKASKYELRTEIKTTTLNGIETSRDTIYIFTPKTVKK